MTRQANEPDLPRVGGPSPQPTGRDTHPPRGAAATPHPPEYMSVLLFKEVFTASSRSSPPHFPCVEPHSVRSFVSYGVSRGPLPDIRPGGPRRPDPGRRAGGLTGRHGYPRARSFPSPSPPPRVSFGHLATGRRPPASSPRSSNRTGSPSGAVRLANCLAGPAGIRIPAPFFPHPSRPCWAAPG